MSRPTPDLLVEKLALGELAPDVAAQVRARLESEGGLGRLPALEHDAKDFTSVPDSLLRRFAAERGRVAERRRASSQGWILAVTAASFAVIAALVAPALIRDEVRDKGGGPALVVYRKAAADRGYEVLGDGARVAPGDVVQLGIRGDGARAAAVYSLDGRGIVTEHLAPSPIPKRREHRLSDAFVLDATPGFERFFLVLGDGLEAAAIREAIARWWASATLETPLLIPDTRVISVHLDKGGGR